VGVQEVRWTRVALNQQAIFFLLWWKPEGRQPLGRPRRKWEDNIKIDLREIGFGDVDWIHLAQDRNRWRALVKTVMSHKTRGVS
jgi:hypothetical protein